MPRKDRRLSPRKEAEPQGDAAAAIKDIDRILETIEDDIPDRAFSAATEFFEDVEEKLKAVRATITATGRVTEKQLSAIAGWDAGVGKWINHG